MADISASVSESCRVLDTVLGAARNTQTDLAAGLLENPLHITDTVTAAIDPEQAAQSPSESRRVLDFVVGAAITNDLAAGLLENPLHITDSLSATLDPLQGAPATEGQRVRDFVFGASGNQTTDRSAGHMENPLHVTDTASAQVINVLQGAPAAEGIRVRDFLVGASGNQTTDQSTGNLENPLHVTDTVTAQVLDVITGAPGSESLRLSDLVYGAAVNTQTDLASGLREAAVRASETPTVLLDLIVSLTETIKIADLNQGRADLWGVLHVQDTVFAGLTPIFGLPATETLKLAESGGSQSPYLDPIQAAVADEALRLSETTPVGVLDPVQASSTETLRLAESGGGQSPYLDPIQTQQPAEALRMADSADGQLDPLQQAAPNEVLKLADGPASVAIVLTASLTETVKLAESGQSPYLDPIQGAATETLLLADTASPTLDPLQAGPAETLKLADTVTAVLFLGVVVVAESVRLADTPLETVNPEETSATETLRLVDTPIVTLGGNLAVLVTETVKIADLNQGRADLWGTLRIQDTVSAGLTPLLGNAAESLKVSDSASPSLNPLQAGPSESLRLQDQLLDFLFTSLSETLRLRANTVTRLWADSGWIAFNASPDHASVTGYAIRLREYGNSTVLATENIGVPAPDGNNVITWDLSGFLAYYSGTFTTSVLTTTAGGSTDSAESDPFSLPLPWPTERVHVTDGPVTGLVTTDLWRTLIEETVRLADAGTSAEQLAVAVPSEVLLLADSASAMAGLAVLLLTETLRLSDKVAILSAAVNAESVRLSDTGRGIVQLFGVVHVTDGPVIANLSNILGVSASEALRIADTVSAVRYPLEVVLTETLHLQYVLSEVEYSQDEYVRIAETVAVSLQGPTDLSSSLADEVLRLADLAPARAITELASASETLLLADSVAASRDITVSLLETLLLADAATAIQDLTGSLAESMVVQDQPQPGRLDPLQVAPSEALRILEVVGADIVTPDTLSTQAQAETVHVTEALAVAIGLQVLLAEQLRLAEQQDVEGPPLLVQADDEALRLSDSAVPALTPLNAAMAEAVLLSDSVAGVPAIPLVVATEHGVVAEDLIQASIDLSVEIPGPEPVPIDALAFSDETLFGDVFTEETLSASMFTDEELKPA